MTRAGERVATAEDCWRGHRVVWRHKPRGGYGYVMCVPVTVVERHVGPEIEPVAGG